MTTPPNNALHRTAVKRFCLALEFFIFIHLQSAVGELIRSAASDAGVLNRSQRR